MHFLLETMKSHFPRLNRAPYCFEDVERIAKRERIHIKTCPHNRNILGYYCTRETPKRLKKYIVLNEGLEEVTRTFVGLHELAHYFAHVPPTSRNWHYCRRITTLSDRKNDCEADTFALIAMIPLPLLQDLYYHPPEELSPELMELCVRRKALFDLHEI